MHAQEVRDLAASSPAPIVPFKAEQVFEQAAIDAMDRVGRGKPLMVIKKGVATHVVDGAGVCSPGKWLPKDRRDVAPGFTRAARQALHGGVLRWCAALGREPRQVLFALAAGQHGDNDVPQAITEELSKELHSIAGHGRTTPGSDSVPGRLGAANYGAIAARTNAATETCWQRCTCRKFEI